ncbi:sugar ABC transporter substrate-binding protein [Hypericibacter adhaerens]|uniref:Sugar ABC transporter substrate-binding protein n=1 Tax=Hypericibacter adhaerens TaxID=2602016 RepID=A0A5J6N6Y4_9PROT|nr:extracellular solute-binding protein [Hypericibacter adhaerens]QEX24745.1 sugar ABC transporter substrate-binding protein [Hypericibacter adhaerens]
MGGATAKAEDITLTVWSHEADETAKVALREQAARNLEASHPGVHVKITWYEKDGLDSALRTALPAGEGPDVFYVEPGETQYITGGFIAPLDDLVDWSNIYDWARAVWKIDGKTWALPEEAYTDELYYNKDWLKKLGVSLPANAQFSQAEFLDLIKKARAADMTPISQGVGDRPYPGAYILAEALLRKLGAEDYGKLLTGELSFEDPRVVAAFTWVKELVDAGAYPKNFMTLKLGESHQYFYRKPGSLLFPMGSFYTGRAFVPVDQGGQAADFPLGIMQFPAMDDAACNECKTVAVGASFAINAASKHKDLAAAYLNELAKPEMGKRWMETVYLQTAVKTAGIQFSGPYAAYFTELMERQNGAKYFTGMPVDILTGQCKETFAQVMNKAFPGGLLTVDDAVKAMNEACYKH